MGRFRERTPSAELLRYVAEIGLMLRMKAVAAQHHATMADVVGPSRTRRIVEARRAVCRMLRELGLSYPDVGALVNRDHTTVMSLLKE